MPNNAGNDGYIVASFGYSGDVCRKFSGTLCCALKLSGTVERKTTNKGVGHCDFSELSIQHLRKWMIPIMLAHLPAGS